MLQLLQDFLPVEASPLSSTLLEEDGLPGKSTFTLMDTIVTTLTMCNSRSPTRPTADAIEGDLYPKYDALNPDHDPQRAIDASSVDKPKQFRRPPSPHPLKISGLSLMSKASHANSDKKSSESSSSDKSSPPKTFLGAITALFYKENREPAKTQDEDPVIQVHISPGKKSPKKSVRFRPENTVIDTETRSSPIDIPKQPPLLPPIDLTRTPIMTAMRRLQDTIPTGRPQPTHVLRNSADFRHARETTKASDILPNMSKKPLTEILPSQAGPTVLPRAVNPPVEPPVNPFDDPPEEIDPEISRIVRDQYGAGYHRRLSSLSSCLEIASGQGVFGTGSKAQMFEGEDTRGTAHISEKKEDAFECFPTMKLSASSEKACAGKTSPNDEKPFRKLRLAQEDKLPTTHPDLTGQDVWNPQPYDADSDLDPPDVFSDSSSTSSGDVLTMVVPKRTRVSIQNDFHLLKIMLTAWKPFPQDKTTAPESLTDPFSSSSTRTAATDPENSLDAATLALEEATAESSMASLANFPQEQAIANGRVCIQRPMHQHDC